jgi:hypothetical protein
VLQIVGACWLVIHKLIERRRGSRDHTHQSDRPQMAEKRDDRS